MDFLSFTLSTGATLFENDDDDRSLSYSLTGGLAREINPRLDLDASLGVNVVDQESGDDAGDDGISINPTGSLGFSYQGPDYTLGLGLSQGINQSSDGDIVSQTTLSGNAAYRITSLSSIDLAIQARNQSPLEGDSGNDQRFTVSVSPSYSVRLTSSWRATVGYRLRFEDEDGDTGLSNGAFLQVSRNFDLLP